jgi:hypothetical protein
MTDMVIDNNIKIQRQLVYLSFILVFYDHRHQDDLLN